MRNAIRKFIIALVVGFIIFLFLGYKAIYIPYTQPKSNAKVTLNIKSGSTVNIIGGKLQRSGLIGSSKWFRLYTLISKTDKQIKSGIYKLPYGLNMIELVEFLTSNKQEVFYHPNKISIPEGLTSEQIISKLVKLNIGSEKELNNLFSNKKFIKDNLGISVSSLEGFIYPKTYFYEDNISAEEFLRKYPLKEFRKEFASYLKKKSFYKDLILASIVEKESGTSQEKPIVASVFKNRLKKRMNLASCATHNKIFYKRGQKPPKILRNKHLEIQSPYNTYKNSGLPPTPICSPSFESFEAVINSSNSDYLYFFADFKGHNIFSKTYNEHNRKKKESWKSS